MNRIFQCFSCETDSMLVVRTNASVSCFLKVEKMQLFFTVFVLQIVIVVKSETNATNPQFRIRVPSGHPSKAHVVVAVAQKYECYRSRMFEDEQVGFTIYEVPPGKMLSYFFLSLSKHVLAL